MYRKISILLLLLILSLSVVYAGADSAFTDDSTTESNISPGESVEPDAVAHPCHSGNDHRRCETEYYPEPCGCLYGTYNCCCGRTMGYFYMPCKEHGYSSKSQSMIIIPAEGESFEAADVKEISDRHSEIKEKIEKLAESKNKAATDTDDDDLTKLSDEVLQKIKGFQE